MSGATAREVIHAVEAMSQDDMDKAADKMVANIEKRRKDGKYSAEEKKKLVDKFVSNMKKVINGEQ